MFRLIFLFAFSILGFMACAPLGVTAGSQVQDGQSNPVATIRPPTSSEVLILWNVDGQETQSLAVIDAATGGLRTRLPYGVLNRDRSLLYAATSTGDGTATTVRVLDIPSGKVLRSATLEGSFELTGETALSPDERLLVLSRQLTLDRGEYERTPAGESTFAVLETSLDKEPRIISLPGSFEVDALYARGDSLYLIEHLQPADSGNYQVRVYDLDKGKLLPEVLGDGLKQVVSTMSGTSLQQVISSDGRWAYSLYLNQEHGPFIHALNMAERWSYCIFLPDLEKDDLSRQLFWSIALSSDGQRLYAANGALGILREYDLAEVLNSTGSLQWIDRLIQEETGQLTEQTANGQGIPHNGISLSPDDRFLYILGGRGICLVEAETLQLMGYFPLDREVRDLAVSRDGSLLYATTSDSTGDILVVDTTTGKIIRTLRGEKMHPLVILGNF